MKRAHIIGIMMIAAAIVTIFMAVGNTSNYVSFSEAGKNPEKEFHVVGLWVKEKGMEYEPSKDPNFFAFYLRDSLNDIHKVVYHNNKPADFERSEKIVVIGKMQKDDFQASSILMKCPSKYENQKIEVQQTGDNTQNRNAN